MPYPEFFEDEESYWSTRCHEQVHWTRAEHRLNRDFGRKRFGDAGYAMEELVAQLGAAFLCADLDITPEVREDHAAYLDSWLKVLQGDRRAIFTAAAHAQRAANFLHDLQPQPEIIPEIDPEERGGPASQAQATESEDECKVYEEPSGQMALDL